VTSLARARLLLACFLAVILLGTGTGDLYPGGTGRVNLTATNANAADVRIRSLTLDTSQGPGGFAVDRTCPLSVLSYTTQTNGGAGWLVPRNGSLAITLPAALAMSTAAANTCQGVVVTVFLSAAS
jgi:hypothetical protein